eukprot:313634-Rhodomonas_salina.1
MQGEYESEPEQTRGTSAVRGVVCGTSSGSSTRCMSTGHLGPWHRQTREIMRYEAETYEAYRQVPVQQEAPCRYFQYLLGPLVLAVEICRE